MTFEVAMESGQEAAVAQSPLADEYVQLAKAPAEGDNDCGACPGSDGDKIGKAEEVPEVGRTESVPIEEYSFQERYPVIGKLGGMFNELFLKDDPVEHLAAVPVFRQAVTDSDTSFTTTETGIKSEIESMGPAAQTFKRDYLSASSDMRDSFWSLPEDQRASITQKIASGVPIEDAVKGHPALEAAEAKRKSVLGSNPELSSRMEEMQIQIEIMHEQKVLARQFLLAGLRSGRLAPSVGPDQMRAMTEEDQRITLELQSLEASIPNVFNYVPGK